MYIIVYTYCSIIGDTILIQVYVIMYILYIIYSGSSIYYLANTSKTLEDISHNIVLPFLL